MNRRKAGPVLVIGSLAVLLSGCAGAAAQGGQVQDNLSPLANAAGMGLARGHVIVREDISQADAARAWSAEARREFHAQQSVQPQSATAWTAEARREFHGQPVTADPQVAVNDNLSPLRGARPAPVPTPAPDTVDDYLSPLRGSR